MRARISKTTAKNESDFDALVERGGVVWDNAAFVRRHSEGSAAPKRKFGVKKRKPASSGLRMRGRVAGDRSGETGSPIMSKN
jgi:hypothetical protein